LTINTSLPRKRAIAMDKRAPTYRTHVIAVTRGSFTDVSG
jgi:hypothetical protein